jgi:methyl-accepting chemotaxis protein
LATDGIATTIDELKNEAGSVSSEIATAVERSRAAQVTFGQIGGTIRDVADIVGSVDLQSEGIAHATHLIETSVEQMKSNLTDFAKDARENGGALVSAQGRLAKLELLSSTMLDTLANSGAETDDTQFIHIAQQAHGEVMKVIEDGLARGLLTQSELFDFDYRPIANSNPQQYDVAFNSFADRYIKPILDRWSLIDDLKCTSGITDINGYLPTHMSKNSHPPSSDPSWNKIHCRNRCNLIDDVTRRAINSENAFMLATYRIQLAEGARPTKTRLFSAKWKRMPSPMT